MTRLSSQAQLILWVIENEYHLSLVDRERLVKQHLLYGDRQREEAERIGEIDLSRWIKVQHTHDYPTLFPDIVRRC